jgi:hypothetical protein
MIDMALRDSLDDSYGPLEELETKNPRSIARTGFLKSGAATVY